MENDRRQVDSGPVQKFEKIRFLFLHCFSKVYGLRVKVLPKKILRTSGPLSDVKVAMRSKTTRGHRHTQIVARSGLKNVSESRHKGHKGWIEEMK